MMIGRRMIALALTVAALVGHHTGANGLRVSNALVEYAFSEGQVNQSITQTADVSGRQPSLLGALQIKGAVASWMNHVGIDMRSSLPGVRATSSESIGR